jgi:hypothetical protein
LHPCSRCSEKNLYPLRQENSFVERQALTQLANLASDFDSRTFGCRTLEAAVRQMVEHGRLRRDQRRVHSGEIGGARIQLSNSQGKKRKTVARARLRKARHRGLATPGVASWCRESAVSKIKRAQGRPGAGRNPWPACSKKCRRQSPQVEPNHPAFPARWCYGFLRALPGDHCLVATVARETR